MSDQGQSLSRPALLRRVALVVVVGGGALAITALAPGPWFVGLAFGLGFGLAAQRAYDWAFDDHLPERTRSQQLRPVLMLVVIVALVIGARRLTW